MVSVRAWLRHALAFWKVSLPLDARREMTNRFRSLISWHLAGTFLLLATTLAASRLAAYRRPGLLIKPLDSVDYRISGFTGTDNPRLSEGVLAKLLPTSY